LVPRSLIFSNSLLLSFWYSFFDEEGGTSPELNLFPSLGVDRLRDMVKAKKRVVVAVGRYKLPALKAALRGKLFNVLITDEAAAKELLNSESSLTFSTPIRSHDKKRERSVCVSEARPNRRISYEDEKQVSYQILPRISIFCRFIGIEKKYSGPLRYFLRTLKI
jgi:Putative sugar-binding domain